MTPPASTEPVYLISNCRISELVRCKYRKDREAIVDGIRARGPVHRAPELRCPAAEFTSEEGIIICHLGKEWKCRKQIHVPDNEEPLCESQPMAHQAPDLSHIHPDRHGCLTCLNPDCPIWQAADQNCWKSLAEHDAALIAQGREKWERERAQQELQPSFDDIDRLNRKVEFYQKRMDMLQCWQSSMRDPERKIVCDILANGFTLTTKEEVDNTAAQAREDVLKELRTAFSRMKVDDCFGEMNSDKCYSYNDNGECFLCAFDSIAESLRSEVGK